jgi:hypothetical protein
MASSAALPAPLTRLAFGSDPIRRAIYVFGMAPAIWYFYLGVTDFGPCAF